MAGTGQAAGQFSLQIQVAERGVTWEEFKVLGVRAEGNPPGLAKCQPHIVVELKPGAMPVHLHQYQLPREAVEGIHKHLTRLRDHEIIKPVQSPWITLLLLIRKKGEWLGEVDY